MKRVLLYLLTLLLFTSAAVLPGCFFAGEISLKSAEEEYIEYRIYTLFADTQNVAYYRQQDSKSFSENTITAEEYIINEESRIEELERIIAQMKKVNVPEDYKESHDYYAQSLEYDIKSIEYNIDFLKTGDMESYYKSIEYWEKSLEYTGKMADTTPKE